MVKLTVLEGPPDEVIAVAKGLNIGGAAPLAAPDLPLVKPASDEKAFVSTNVARKVLNRRPLSKEQKIVLTTLAKAHPDFVPATDLHAATGYAPAQLAGLMGAFGRRFTHTDGFVANTLLFDYEWNEEAGIYNYRLPDSVLEAMKSEKLI